MDEKPGWLAYCLHEGFQSLPGRSHWEIWGGHVARSDLCFQVHTGLWGDKGLKTARGNEGPLRHSHGGQSLFKDYRKEGAGTEPGDHNLILAYSASSSDSHWCSQEWGDPAIRNEWCLSQTLQKGGNAAQQPTTTFPQGFLFYKGPEWDWRGNLWGTPFPTTKYFA